MIAGELAHYIRAFRIPGQGNRTGREIVGSGKVEERWQQRPGSQLAWRHELRNGKRMDLGPAAFRPALQVDVCERTVRCSEIDANQITRHVSFGKRLFQKPLSRVLEE